MSSFLSSLFLPSTFDLHSREGFTVLVLPSKTRKGNGRNNAYFYFLLQNVESLAASKGYNVTWEESGGLYLWQNLPAFIRHPLTGKKIWFNQAHSHHPSYYKQMPGFLDVQIPDEKFPANTYYGDGSEIEPEVIQHIRATSWECAVGFQWRSGDLLVLDNLAVQHARIGFTGDRKILAYLSH